jgi:Mrp family chromosome partitioning ATPase
VDQPLLIHKASEANASLAEPVKSGSGRLTTARPPSQERSFVALFQAVDALRAGDRAFVLQFTAAHEGAGTTTLASGFAAAAAAVSRQPVLYVDVNAQARPDAQNTRMDLLSTFRALLPLSAAMTPARGANNLFWARLHSEHDAGGPLDGEEIRQLLTLLREMHPVVVLDCPPLDTSSQAVAFARHCDGTVLVVAAEASSKNQILAARQQIERSGGQIVGAVFNRQRSYLPRWLQRML